MTIRFTEGDGIPDDFLGFTEDMYRWAIADLRTLIAAIEAGRIEDIKAAKTAVKDLREVGKLLVQERAHVEALRKQVAGSVGTGTELDLGPRAMKSGAVWLASATQEEIDSFMAGLSEATLLALPFIFEFWALPHQLPPRETGRPGSSWAGAARERPAPGPNGCGRRSKARGRAIRGGQSGSRWWPRRWIRRVR